MKSFRRLAALVVAAFIFLAPFAYPKSSGSHSSGSSVHVKGYTKKDGTYVAPHERSAPNHTKSDNWSTKGNVNPYTGKEGTKNADNAVTGSGQPSQAETNQKAIKREGWTKPPLGKSKQEILAVYGEPNIKTGKKWIYSGKGEILFNDQGVTQ